MDKHSADEAPIDELAQVMKSLADLYVGKSTKIETMRN